MTSRRNRQPRAEKSLLITLYAGFFLIGILTVLLGQILPFLSSRLSLNDRQAGYLFVVQFAGSLLGTSFYNRAIKKFGYLKILFAAFCSMAVGCAWLNFGAAAASFAAIFIYGLGIGAAIPTINLLAVELNDRENSSSALNTINLFWGLGAILCKPFVDSVGSPGDITLPTVLLAVLFSASGLTILFSSYREDFAANENITDAISTPIWTTKTAWLIAAFNFIHVGIESSVGGWITTFERRSTANSGGWLSAALVFFFFLVFGRAVAPLFFRFARENAVLLSSLIVMTAGTILILSARQFSTLIFGAAVLGFGCSSVFPTNTARFTTVFGSGATRNAAPLFILGSLGGAFATWFVGLTSTVFNDLRAGLSIILIGCLLLIILQTVLAKTTTRRFSD